MPHIVMVDGLPVDVANPETAATVVKNAVGARDTANAALEASQSTVTARDATIAAKDAEISNLKDQVAAAKLTPQQLRDAAASYVRSLGKAKALGAPVTDSMDESAIVAAAVKHKLGDKAANYTPEQNSAAFDALEAPAGSTPTVPVGDSLAAVLGDQPANLGDAVTAATKARDARFSRFTTAHSGAAAPTVQ